jgi:hypothetical protein
MRSEYTDVGLLREICCDNGLSAAQFALGWRFVGVGSRLKGKRPDWIADFSSLTPDRTGG